MLGLNSKMNMITINQLQLIPFPSSSAKEATLSIFQSPEAVPFAIKRVFTIHAHEACQRGRHAHKECTQLLVVLRGKCKVICDDGTSRKDIILNKPSEGLLVPPGIWAEQDYEPNTLLMVLTDKPYDESDYIRNYEDYLAYRGVA